MNPRVNQGPIPSRLKSRPLVFFAGGCVALFLSGCLHTPNLEPSPLGDMPSAFSTNDGTQTPPQKWWTAFDDPSLNTLVDQALGGNQELQATWSRLNQAEAMLTQANSSWWPSLNASVSGGRTKQSSAMPESNLISGSLQASYEVDVWGKLNNQRQAAAMDFAATRDSLEAAAMTLAAEVSDTWFGWVAQQQQITLLKEQLETNKTYLELVEVRFSEGLASALDVFNLQQQVEQTRSQLENTQGLARVMGNKLAVLLGKAPTELKLETNVSLPTLPQLPKTGLPSQLLQNRPDVRAAQRGVAAADARIGVALANRFPALKLTGSVGFSATTFTGLFDELVFSVLGSALVPIFQGGALVAQQTQAEAALQEKLHRYSHSVLVAISEVETALSSQHHEAKRLMHLEKQRDFAASALGEARERYLAGLSEFLPVLTALGTLQRIETNVVLSQKQVRSYRIQLCRALGGSWTRSLEQPTLQSENPS